MHALSAPKPARPHQHVEDLHPLYPPVLGVPIRHLGDRLGHAACSMLGTGTPLLPPAAPATLFSFCIQSLQLGMWHPSTQLAPCKRVHLATPEACSQSLCRAAGPADGAESASRPQTSIELRLLECADCSYLEGSEVCKQVVTGIATSWYAPGCLSGYRVSRSATYRGASVA